MVSQGLWGAIEQYWTVEDKPRLHRRNTYFDDHTQFNDNWTILNLVLIAVTISITIVIFWSIRWII
jgi:hypothetical protein